MSTGPDLLVDPVALREQVQDEYREVATDPTRTHPFHAGRGLARRLGYDEDAVAALPDRAVESFAGVADPCAPRPLTAGERVVDVGCGAGFDSFLAAEQVGPDGRGVGVDMTPEMLEKATGTAAVLGLDHVEFRAGRAESRPVEDSRADVVVTNGVIDLCADEHAVLSEIRRVLRPGGRLQFAGIANGRPVPEGALRDIDPWTGWIAGGLPRAGWPRMLAEIGCTDIAIGDPVDTSGGAGGEPNARAYAVHGYSFLARTPTDPV